MTLVELKAKAQELGLTPDEVRAYGSLSYKATWEQAINEFEQWKESVNTHCEQFDIPQWTYSEDETVEDIAVTVNQGESICQRICKAFNCVECPDCEGLGDILNCLNQFELCIRCDGSGMVPNSESNEGELVKPTPGGFFLGKDDRALPLYSGWVDSENNWLNVYSLKPSAPIPPIAFVDNLPDKIWYRRCFKSSNPIRDELLQRMAKYVGDCVSPQEFEQLKSEPLDEKTAAVYLGWLEESEQMLKEALAA